MKIFLTSAILEPKNEGQLKSWKKVPRKVLFWEGQKVLAFN